jgi:serine/threonine protein kinase
MTLQAVFDGGPILDGKYRLERRLGRGGMGVVYGARHLGLDKHFALKLIHSARSDGPSFAERFEIEARALGKLEHPNIVQVTDYGVDRRSLDLPYLVMELLEGKTLREVCGRVGALPMERALPLLESIASAVDHAHRAGVLHRDLKPANVFLTSSHGGVETAKILDFGLARLVSQPDSEPSPAAPAARRAVGPAEASSCSDVTEVETRTHVDDSLGQPTSSVDLAVRVTQPGAFLGTPPYMAPEVLSGVEATWAADIYAFGVLAYEVLVGSLPFTGTRDEILRSRLNSSPPIPSALRPSLPPELDAALLAPLVEDPVRRPGTCTDVVGAIRSAWRRAQAREWRAREMPRRVRLSGLLAPVIVLASLLLGRLEPVRRVELWAADARFARQPSRSPDPRLLIVSLDEASLAMDPTPLSQKADEFGRELERVLAAGARGVAIDFLLTETWSRSPAFSRLVLKRADKLILATYSSPTGATIGTACLSGLTAAALGPARSAELFGFVNVDEDRDGVIRRARLSYADREGAKRDSFALRAARPLLDHVPASRDRFWIDHSIDWRRFRWISWKDLATELAMDPSQFRDRVVLVGGDFAASGDEHFRVPARAGLPVAVSGVVLQALALDTILSGLPVREARAFPFELGAGLASVAVVFGILCIPRPARAIVPFAALNCLYLFACFRTFRASQILLPMTVPILTGIPTVALALLLGSRLSPFPKPEVER